MSFQGNKIRQLWLPFLILALIILALSWILAGVVYPNNVQGNDEIVDTPTQVTTTASPTVTSTRTPLPTQTRPVDENTPSATAIYNCTYTLHYWRTNPDSWMIENIVIGNLSFSKAEAIVILDIEFPNPTTRMVQQFFAALLNTLKGADPADIDQTMVAVGEWLIIHPPGIDLTEAEIIEVDAMAEVLEAHNTGITGPGHCADEPFTPTPEATFTATATRTSTPAPVRTSPPRTPTPTKKSSGSKPKPTKPPETSPPSQPTNTPKPQPTSTPKPQATNTPRTTPTSPPPPTPEP